jgi:hypothetical protein
MLNDEIARKFADALLRCRVCGRAFGPTLGEIAEYLSNGWPSCCDEMMTFSARAALAQATSSEKEGET